MSERSTENYSSPRLAALELEPGSILFDPDVTEYSLKVDADVTKILVRAEADSDQTSYVVSGNSGLKPGENQIQVTVTDGEGNTAVYRIHVQVGESTAAEETVLKQEAAETVAAEPVQVSLVSYALNGPIRYVTMAVGGCLIAAAVFWAVFAARKHMEKRAEEIKKQERRIARERQKERQQTAMRQEEELLRQIEILTEKSRSGKGSESAGGLRIIELSEEEAMSAKESAPDELTDVADDLLDDFYDDDDDDDDYEDYEDYDGDES